MDYREDPREEPGEETTEGTPGEQGTEFRKDALEESEYQPSGEYREDPWGEPETDQSVEPVEAEHEGLVQEEVYVSEDSEVASRPGQHYIGKAIVSIKEGRKIGTVDDIVINRDNLQVAAVITSKGAFFSREIEAIPANEIKVWGEDVILVAEPDVIQHESKIPERKLWLNLNDSIRGRYVVSVDGTRVGQINDVIIDTNGRLRGYELSKVFIEGPVAKSKRIAADATHSLGKDVLIVNTIEALTYPDEEKGQAENDGE